MSANRPIVNDEMKMAAARELAAKMGLGENSAEDIAQEYRHHMDGFALAKALDKWCSWDTSREEMEALDEMDVLVGKALKAAERQWFADNNIQPPFPIGTQITRGLITGIYEHDIGRYLVKENGCTKEGRHLIIKFEDAVAA